MLDNISGHGLQPVVASDQVVLAGELPLQLLLLLLVQFRLLEQLFHVFVQLLVGELQLRDPVLVVEGHRGPVFHGLTEVIDAHVVAEDLASLLLAHDERGAGEGEEGGPGQGRAHVERQGVVLAAVGLVGDDDDILPLREHRVLLPAFGAELVDQGEDIAVVLGQEPPQVPAALGLGAAFGDHARGRKVLVDLAVQLPAVRDHHEGPVARHLSEHLLRKEDHRNTLAAALGVPEHPEPAFALLDLGQGLERVVDAEVLVVLGHQFDQPARRLHEEDEVFYDIQQPLRRANPAEHRLQRNASFLRLAAHLFPLGKMLPAGGDAAHPALAAVGEDDERVVPEEMRNGVLVIAEVVGVRGLEAAVRGFKLNEDQRKTVDEAHQIRPAGVHLARDPELGAEQEVVVLWGVPIHHPHPFDLLPVAFGISHPDAHAVLEQVVNLTVRRNEAHTRTIAGQFLDGLVERLGRSIRVELLQSRAKARGQNHLGFGLSAQRARAVIELAVCVERVPAEFLKQSDGGLLNQGIFGVFARHSPSYIQLGRIVAVHFPL